MHRQPFEDTLPAITIASAEGSALVAAFVPGLANTVLFHLARLPFGPCPALCLHVVYREGDTTFDATARLDACGDGGALKDMLLRFTRSEECLERVVAPLVARVGAGFSH